MQMLLAKIASPEFRRSLDKISAQELPIRAMFRLKGIVKRLREEMKTYDEFQAERAVKYATKDLETQKPIVDMKKSGVNYYRMEHEAMLHFTAEMGELAKTEIEVPEFPISELGPVSLTTDDLLALEFLIDG